MKRVWPDFGTFLFFKRWGLKAMLVVASLWLFAGHAHAQAYNEKLCPADFPEHGILSEQSPKCYQQCKPDFAGIGGLCVDKTSTDCMANGSCIAPATCKPGQSNLAGVCHNTCPSTHSAVGPLCIEKPPSGWSVKAGVNHLIERVTWNRQCRWGVCVSVPKFESRMLHTYSRTAGLANQCKAGQTNRFGVCVNNGLQVYVRSHVEASSVPHMATDSFVRPVSPQANDESFTVAVLSDPQLPWDETSAEGIKGGQSRASLWANSRAFNLSLVQSVNALQTSLRVSPAPLAFTVINGDLTAFFHPEELSEFRAFYDNGFQFAYPNVLQSPVFLGLGNHDYENNLGSCQSFSWDKNRCAKNAINLIRGSVFAGYMKNMPAHTIESFDAGSLAYSWNRGRYHFVQLHNDASYKIPRLGISPSTEWLRADLARAKARGQSIVINVHKPSLNKAFLQAIDGQPVVAIFAGHLHESVGKQKDVKTPSGQNVPVFLSGSADKQTFLKVGFEPTQVAVTPMSSKGGQPVPLGETVALTVQP